jgi:carbonic anhydrase
MSTELTELFDSNRRWAEHTEAREPGFFTRLLEQQTPQYLWIGCADSRVIPELLTSSSPGRLFVVRNVANIVPTFANVDSSVGAALEYGVGVLGIDNIIVCGHTGCGGVHALLVQGVPGFVGGAEHRGRQVVPTVAGGDAHVLAGERDLKRMHSGVQSAALQVVAQLLGQGQAEAALLGLWKIAKQKVAPPWRLRLGSCQ